MSNAKQKTRIRFPGLLEHQQHVIQNLKPLNALVWGAQCGKTRISLYTQGAYLFDHKGSDNIWIDRDGKFARDAFRLAGALLPKELIKDKSKIDLRYELVNGSVWSFFSGLEPDAFRGKTRHSAVFNEAAYVKPEGWKEVIAPRLRGWALFNTTPKGRRNWTFTDIWADAGAKPHLWYRSQISSVQNTFIPDWQKALWKETLTDSLYRQEILAEFVSDFGQFFSPHPKCWTGRFESYDPNGRYAAGLDYAKVNDFSAYAIIRIDTFPRRFVALGRLPHMDYTAQEPILERTLKQFGNPTTLADASEEMMNERLRKLLCKVEDFHFGATSKQYVMNGLRVVMEKGEVTMPPSAKRIRALKDEGIIIPYPDINVYSREQKQNADWLDDEIEFFEPYIQGGVLKFGARGTHHDDLLAAMMLANEAANQSMQGASGGIVVSSGGRGRKF